MEKLRKSQILADFFRISDKSYFSDQNSAATIVLTGLALKTLSKCFYINIVDNSEFETV